MSFKKFLAGSLAGGTVSGALSAALNSMAGSTGAAILNAAGHAGYSVLEGAQMGAVGGAVLGGGYGLIKGGLATLGMFSDSDKGTKEKESENCLSTAIKYTGSAVISGLTGFGIMNASSALIMDVGRAAASFAVGGAVTMIPAGIAILCIALPIVLCAERTVDEVFTEEQSAAPRV